MAMYELVLLLVVSLGKVKTNSLLITMLQAVGINSFSGSTAAASAAAIK